jgi:hypothetical protein
LMLGLRLKLMSSSGSVRRRDAWINCRRAPPLWLHLESSLRRTA